MTALAHARLGRSELHVSRVALGSWRTFERMPREQGVAVMRAAREAGIDFLDDARYDDDTGTAPIPTGYSAAITRVEYWDGAAPAATGTYNVAFQNGCPAGGDKGLQRITIVSTASNGQATETVQVLKRAIT